MKRITGRFEAEIIVKKSRFIAIAQPIAGLDDVRGIVKGIWDEHKDATHVVHAAVAGANGSPVLMTGSLRTLQAALPSKFSKAAE